jgi:hypothetical protein
MGHYTWFVIACNDLSTTCSRVLLATASSASPQHFAVQAIALLVLSVRERGLFLGTRRQLQCTEATSRPVCVTNSSHPSFFSKPGREKHRTRSPWIPRRSAAAASMLPAFMAGRREGGDHVGKGMPAGADVATGPDHIRHPPQSSMDPCAWPADPA